MAQKENKGGLLTNKQVEQDLKIKGKENNEGGYNGSQDTGDKELRQIGTEVQKRDGALQDETEIDTGK